MKRYSYLGPAGTFTEMALQKFLSAEDQCIPAVNVTAALDAVRTGNAELAIVPIENSVEGVVARTLDELAVGEPLVIVAETTIPVTFTLFANPNNLNLDSVKTLATHPHAESQCRSYIAKHYPNTEIIQTPSTAAAAVGLLKNEWDLAIAAPINEGKYNLQVVAENIGDITNAVTRFVVVEKPGNLPPRTGYDRTSVAVFIDQDHAGALLEILTEFAKHEVNLTFIQSRPTGRALGHYHFIIDVEGHIEDSTIKAALNGLNKICDEVRFLGSYPRT
jgi:prephenate dehydratase